MKRKIKIILVLTIFLFCGLSLAQQAKADMIWSCCVDNLNNCIGMEEYRAPVTFCTAFCPTGCFAQMHNCTSCPNGSQACLNYYLFGTNNGPGTCPLGSWSCTIETHMGFCSGGGTTPPSPPPALTCSLSASPAAGVAGLPVTFTNTVTGSYSRLVFDYGDGTNCSVNLNQDRSVCLSHTYSSGTFQPKLTVTSGDGQSTTECLSSSITVSALSAPANLAKTSCVPASYNGETFVNCLVKCNFFSG